MTDCPVCAVRAGTAERDGKLGYITCGQCLDRDRAELRAKIIVATGKGLDYIGREMLGVARTATVEIDFGNREPSEDGVIGTWIAVESDAAYRMRVLARVP